MRNNVSDSTVYPYRCSFSCLSSTLIYFFCLCHVSFLLEFFQLQPTKEKHLAYYYSKYFKKASSVQHSNESSGL